MKAIVLAGGGGTRLWPLSREDFPKQFLNFGSGLSLLQRSVQRLLRASFIEEIIVATSAHHLSLVEKQLKAYAKVRIIVEPVRKNTAPAIGFSVRYLQQYCGAKESDTVIVLPSDHLIEPESLFLQAVEQMGEMAGANLITFGIRPTKAETGYGYIKIGRKFDGLTFKVARFIEKPDRETAEKYVGDPHFYWNAGIFIFSIGAFWTQLQRYAPQIFSLLNHSYERVLEHFDQMPDISIDYALLEKSKEILICPLAVSWSDVGCWDSVYDVMEKDQDRNVKRGDVLAIDTTNSLIFGGSRLISTIGLEDMLIVETEDALFISKKGESQRVRALVKELNKKFTHKIQVQSWGDSLILCEADDYRIQKIQISPGKIFEYEKKLGTECEWIELKGEAERRGEGNKLFFLNLTAGGVEILLIEKRVRVCV